MSIRTTFGRKNIGHPFRASLAPHIRTPVLSYAGDVIAPEQRSNAFRAALPEGVLRLLPEHEPEVVLAMERAKLRSNPVNPRLITLQDVKDFLLAYCACFLAVLAFIS